MLKIQSQYQILLLVFVSIPTITTTVFSQSRITVKQDPQNRAFSLQNSWIAAKFHRSDLIDVKMDQTAFLTAASTASVPGAHLQLYTDHPLAATQTLPLPTEFQTTVSTFDDGAYSLARIQSIADNGLSLARTICMTARESIILVTTTLTNTGNAARVFYPAEIVPINGNPVNSVSPELGVQFYSPFTDENPNSLGFQIIAGATDTPQFQSQREPNLFLARYQNQKGKIKLTNDRRWFAALHGDNNRVAAWEYKILSKHPEAVRDNLLVTISSATPEIHMTYLLGKVTLAPQESFTYTTLWSFSTCLGPIVDVQNGVVFRHHLEVLIGKPEFPRFYVLSAFGIPVDGPVGFQFFDASGNMINNNYNISLQLDPRVRRPFDAVPNYPNILSHALGFPLEMQDSIMKETKQIRLVLLDEESKQPIRLLDISNGPWNVYEGNE